MAEPILHPGSRIGKYRILCHIATGGMGAVYKAQDEVLGRVVALKVLSADASTRPSSLERFQREARYAARLKHKNIVTLFDSGQVDGIHFLALELVEGIDLGAYISRKRQLPPEEARLILLQAVRALDHAYQQGIIHRDIKPSNFLLTNENGRLRVKLTDMGLAQRIDDMEFRVTRAGSTVGTVDYLSPEQARDSSSADTRSDIYSLGCTFYHMLAGEPPFSEGGLGERILKHLEAVPPDIRQQNPAITSEMAALLNRMLAKDPAARFQTPGDLYQALKALPGDKVAHIKNRHLRTIESASSPTPAYGSEEVTRVVPASMVPPRVEAPPPASEARSEERLPPPRLAADSPALLGLSSEEVEQAAQQFNRAIKAQAANNLEGSLELLLGCCRMDPTNLLYRQTLREVSRATLAEKPRNRWLGRLSSLGNKTRLKTALHSGNHRKVLEQGEEVLLRNPRDQQTHIDMAESAQALGLVHLAAWLLEEARLKDPLYLPFHRHLAYLYEEVKEYGKAIALWELVRKVDPNDPDAARRLNDLAASQTIARSTSRR